MFGISEEKKALAGAYKALMVMPGWIDLEKYAEEERDSSMKRVDSKSANDLSLGYVCEERGIRKGIAKLIQYAKQNAEGI